MAEDSKQLYVGIDAHQDTLSIAVLVGNALESEELVTLPNKAVVIRKWFRKLAERGEVAATYEAGCLGFVLFRLLTSLGVQCVVAAPSHLPKIPGDRRKTDRLDALRLAKFLRAGQITAVTPPTPELEALRGLTRTREAMKRDATRIQQRILKFLLLRGHVYRDGDNWTAKHRRWLRDLRLELEEDRLTLDFLLAELEHRELSVGMLDERLERRAEQPDVVEMVRCVRAFRGFDTVAGLSIVAEIGDPRRFASTRQVAAFCGLVPSEHSSGTKVRRGAITRAGNHRLRRLVVEAAQHYRKAFSPRSYVLKRRAEAPERVQSIAAKAERRLKARYFKLAAHKHTNVAKAAIARELIGFLWVAMLPAQD